MCPQSSSIRERETGPSHCLHWPKAPRSLDRRLGQVVHVHTCSKARLGVFCAPGGDERVHRVTTLGPVTPLRRASFGFRLRLVPSARLGQVKHFLQNRKSCSTYSETWVVWLAICSVEIDMFNLPGVCRELELFFPQLDPAPSRVSEAKGSKSDDGGKELSCERLCAVERAPARTSSVSVSCRARAFIPRYNSRNRTLRR